MTNPANRLARKMRSKKFLNLVRDAGFRFRLGAEIFAGRAKKSWSQKNLATAAETTQRIISQIENGEINPGLILLGRLSLALELTGETLSQIFSVPLTAASTYMVVGFSSFHHDTPTPKPRPIGSPVIGFVGNAPLKHKNFYLA